MNNKPMQDEEIAIHSIIPQTPKQLTNSIKKLILTFYISKDKVLN